MDTLIILAALAITILLLEIFNLRKIIIPFTLLGLGFSAYTTIYPTDYVQFEMFNAMEFNAFSKWFSVLFIILAMGLVALGHDVYQRKQHQLSDFISLKIFLLIGAICMISFNHLVMFFMGLEILSITLYILAASVPKSIQSNEAGMKYFLMGSFASGFILFGIALLYGASATFYLNELLLVTQWKEMPNMLRIGFVLIAVGMLFKIAAFPFHFWAPDVYQGAPALSTASMSTLAKVAAMASFFKLATVFQPVMTEYYIYLLIVIMIATMFVGNIVALKQDNIKRLLAYSGISHAGFMLMAFLNLADASQELLYYAAAYATAGIAAFAVIISVTGHKPDESLQYFKGLGKSNPTLAMLLSIALISMAGIPIFSGFFAKLFLFQSTLEKGYILVVIAAVINSIISIYYYFKVIMVMYTKSDEEHLPTFNPSWIYPTIAVIFLIFNLTLGLNPNIILQLF